MRRTPAGGKVDCKSGFAAVDFFSIFVRILFMRKKTITQKSKSIIFKSYKHLITKLEEKNRRHKLDMMAS